MRNWQRDGWTEKDWEDITESDDDLRAVAHLLDNSIGGGGGGFQPAELLHIAARLQAMADRLKCISESYL